jgi:hypothetical protein
MTTSRDPDRLIRAFLADGEETLQDRVYDVVRAEIEQRPQRAGIGPRRTLAMNRIVGFGLGAAAVVVAVVVGLQVLGAKDTGVAPGPTATPEAPRADHTAEPTSSPSTSAAPEQDDVRGWPSTRQNAAGTYSWNGNRCGGSSCVLGFMHNGYGSGDVAIRIGYFSGATLPDEGVRAVVAGQDGIYHRIDAQREEWIVDIEGATIAISLTAEPGTSKADLDEAHAIIDSMRTEPTETGFRIVFTLTTDDWDSG